MHGVLQSAQAADTSIAETFATFNDDIEAAKRPPGQAIEGIAILGSHPDTKLDAPFDAPWLIYACSPHNAGQGNHPLLPRVDEWFEIHVPITHPTRSYSYLRRLEEMPCVWMRDRRDIHHFPGAKAYPEVEMKKEFNPFAFTSTIAFMMAKAIVDAEKLGVKQIGLWGIMQASPNEYVYQRPGIQYFIWEAGRRGMKVLAPEVSKLFEPPKEDF